MSWDICCRKMCRACMKIDGVLLPMYDDGTIGSKNLPDKLTELTSIQIDRFDSLPHMLCAKCAYRTIAFYDFKLQVQATEKKLRKMFDTRDIKEEVDTSEHEQDCIIPMIELSERKLQLDEVNINTVDAHTVNKGLTDRIKINTEREEPIEFDSFPLVQESFDSDRANTHSVENVRTDHRNKLHIKNELPNEITTILESHDLDYTIMYIPDIVIDPTAVNNDDYYEPECEVTIKHEDGKKISSVCTEILNEAGINEEFLDDIFVPECMETKSLKNVEDRGKSWDAAYTNDIPIKKESNETSNETCAISEVQASAKESDASDSDYFIDPKDNVLGSLNDTITRIKEIKVDNDTIQYQCTLCLQNYEKLTGVLLHTIDNHVPSSGPFFCVVCEKDCDSHRQLRAHVKTHKGQFPYSCFICNKAYSLKRYLKRHMVCHTEFPRHRCPKCGARFKTKSELEDHVTTHVHGAPYACNQCPRIFNHKGNYKRHLITHLDPQGLHLPKYPCSVCGKRFLNNRTLETHMRVHTGEKPFKCEVCGRSFSQQGNLLNHLRIHSNPRSYTCEVCGKRFNQRATLKDHSLLHTGEKPYVCNVCGIAFTFSAALRRHMWTHAAGKPFGCEICNARFVGKYDLRRHMRVHSDRPRARQRRGGRKTSNAEEESKEVATVEGPDTETVLIEQVLLNQDATQVVPQEEAEKENVDALFNLIQYG